MTLITSRTARGDCPLCGAQHATCGQPSTSAPVDERMEVAAVGGPLKKYKVTTPQGMETVMKLNEEDAKRLDAEPADVQPQASAGAKPAAKKRTASNKARTTANKDGGAGGGDD